MSAPEEQDADNVVPMPITTYAQFELYWKNTQFDHEALEEQLADSAASKRLMAYLEETAHRAMWPRPRLAK
jgi:hypothetical protein